MIRKPKPPRWVWCPTCASYLGASPPVLPPYWSLDKTAAMHIHKVERHTLARVLARKDLVWA